MDGQLVQVSLPSHFPLELASPVENLSPEVAELRALVHRLQAENHEFRQQAGYRGMIQTQVTAQGWLRASAH